MTGALSDQRLDEIKTAIGRAATSRDDLNPDHLLHAWILATWDLADEVDRLRGENEQRAEALAAELAATRRELDAACCGPWHQRAAAEADEITELRARIGNARAEIRKQDTAASLAMRPGWCAVSDALAAVETHLVDPEHRPTGDGSEA